MTATSLKAEIGNYLWKTDDNRSLRVGVGCAYMGSTENGRLVRQDEDVDVLLRTYEKGFRFYDTSADYGQSEIIVGMFLKQIPRDTVFVATKSYFPWRTSADAFSQFVSTFEQSFERLGIDVIDLYQIHDTDHFESCEHQVIPFLEEQKRRGRIRYIGIGTRSINAEMLAVLSGRVDSVLSYQNYSILTRAATPLIRLCREKGCAFINASVLHFGLIKSQDPLHYRSGWREGVPLPSHWEHLQQITKQIQDLCRREGINILDPALQYSLLDPDVDILLNGIHRISNLESTIAAMSRVVRPEIWAEIFRIQNRDPYSFIQRDLQH